MRMSLQTTAKVLILTLFPAAVAWGQEQKPSQRPMRPATSGPPVAGNWPNASAPSHIFSRGDVEIVSFDTEETYDRLEALYAKSKEK